MGSQGTSEPLGNALRLQEQAEAELKLQEQLTGELTSLETEI